MNDTNEMNDLDEVLRVEDLNVYFGTGDGGEVHIVRDVNFTVRTGETVGIVGESGSGKSVTGLALMRLLNQPQARVEGKVLLRGRNLLELSEKEIEGVRGKQISMIFQEPATALDPVFTVGQQLVETIRTHCDVSKSQARERAIELLDSVGIAIPARRFHEYPHQLSGGMKQRVMIAIALSCEPDLIVADEPTTAVDVTIQAQILRLLRRMTVERGVALVFITHDLGVVAEFCSRAMTMYAGEVVEMGDVADLLTHPAHPYTSGLLRAIPRTDQRGRDLYEIPGTVPSPRELVSGCRFGPRCEFAEEPCTRKQQLVDLPELRKVRCVRSRELVLPGAIE